MAESLASGTPVVAYDRGSMRELLRDGIDGALVSDRDAAVAAVAAVGSLDRAAIRLSARHRFDRATMTRRYVEVYEQILRR